MTTPPEGTPAPLEIGRRTVLKAGAAGTAVAALPLAACSSTLESVPPTSGPREVALRVNGEVRALSVEPRVTLLDALRERMGLTGTKKGCDRGECGACTVLVDGRRIKSCMTLAVMQDGREVTTVEGLARGGELHPVQAAFVRQDGLQCGFCTPGQIMSAVAVIEEGHTSSDAEIREWMSGNLCRCSCYPNIVAAVREAAEEVR
ncbi:xanthine dehydrogenase YagT iron-sulfur-binding subunit [Pseudonocardia hierapolitana]|uniref:Xanthine dehydrogenase YagT iron-sulfur-binding subunit n=1 Tax=Pseudonocardia hierapolitana TaxID=1128676 RepID=A0A561SJU5_9PSEU|nr:xanthine dehydrogenase YagT iron-sulfur-binding subunit [Pseudonocardia hierapolitana]